MPVAALSISKSRVLRRNKDRTKAQEDRDVEVCPRALEILRRHSESIMALNVRTRGPCRSRHTSVTSHLMLGMNLLWVAKRHGHSNAATNRTKLIVIRPLESLEFGGSSAVGNGERS